MKIDHEYIRKLMEVFETDTHPTITIRDIDAAGLGDDENRLIFHMAILNDQNIVVRADREAGFGLFVGVDGHRSWGAVPLRLTAAGHEFLAATANPDVWQKTKHEAARFGGMTVGLITSIAKAFMKQKIEEHTGLKVEF